jgi:D-threonate/D-erythronate kinase
VAACAANAPVLIYKKTDSTLRGNIGAELRALYHLYGGPIAYVPAYPEMGRTVVDGSLLVHGIPVAETPFGRDPLNPVACSEVRALLHPACDCVVFDGDTPDHVREAAHTILTSGTFRIIAGPGAIAGAIARLLGNPATLTWPPIPTCLVVNGSRHEISRRQIENAAFDQHWRLFHPQIPPGAHPLHVARCVGAQVRDTLEQHPCNGLLVFGGDTAYGILESLGSPPLRPIGEIVPGVPISRIDGRRELLITKAGGFGQPDLINRLRSILNANER